jgi:DNA-binding GntR family transcriptional regulator
MLLSELYYQLRLHRLRSSTQAGRAQQALSEHREILDALASRNPDAAEGAMRHHIRNAHLNLVTALATKRTETVTKTVTKTLARRAAARR